MKVNILSLFQEEIGEKIVKTLVHVKMEVVVNLTPVNAFVLQDGMVYTVKIHAIKTIMELIGKYYYLFSTKVVLLKKMQLLQSFFLFSYSAHQCNCQVGQRCHHVSGECIPCSEGTYGMRCAQKCECSENGTALCLQTTGQCFCHPNFYGNR